MSYPKHISQLRLLNRLLQYSDKSPVFFRTGPTLVITDQRLIYCLPFDEDPSIPTDVSLPLPSTDEWSKLAMMAPGGVLLDDDGAPLSQAAAVIAPNAPTPAKVCEVVDSLAKGAYLDIRLSAGSLAEALLDTGDSDAVDILLEEDKVSVRSAEQEQVKAGAWQPYPGGCDRRVMVRMSRRHLTACCLLLPEAKLYMSASDDKTRGIIKAVVSTHTLYMAPLLVTPETEEAPSAPPAKKAKAAPAKAAAPKPAVVSEPAPPTAPPAPADVPPAADPKPEEPPKPTAVEIGQHVLGLLDGQDECLRELAGWVSQFKAHGKDIRKLVKQLIKLAGVPKAERPKDEVDNLKAIIADLKQQNAEQGKQLAQKAAFLRSLQEKLAIVNPVEDNAG